MIADPMPTQNTPYLLSTVSIEVKLIFLDRFVNLTITKKNINHATPEFRPLTSSS